MNLSKTNIMKVFVGGMAAITFAMMEPGTHASANMRVVSNQQNSQQTNNGNETTRILNVDHGKRYQVIDGWKIDLPFDTSKYTTASYEYKQCTWWAYNRAKELGINYDMYMGSGAQWQHKAGYEVTTKPTLHSAVSFNPGQMVGGQWKADSTYGHVAFVEDIHPDGSILISQSGTGFKTEYNYQVLSAKDAAQLHYVIGK